MSRLTSAAVLIAAAVAVSLPAGARTTYYVQTDNWFVTALTNSCIAFNRQPSEYNQSPWNSLTLHAPKDGGFLVEVVFWPGFPEHGKLYKLKLQVEGRGVHEIDATEGVGGIALKSSGPMPDDLVDDLRTGRMLTVGTTGVPVSLGFETTRIPDILTHLDNCRRMLGQE